MAYLNSVNILIFIIIFITGCKQNISEKNIELLERDTSQFRIAKKEILTLYDSALFREALTKARMAKSTVEQDTTWTVKFMELEGACLQMLDSHKTCVQVFDSIISLTDVNFMPNYFLNAISYSSWSKNIIGDTSNYEIVKSSIAHCRKKNIENKFYYALLNTHASQEWLRGKKKSCLNTFMEIYKNNPGNFIVRLNIAKLYGFLGDYSRALDSFYSLVKTPLKLQEKSSVYSGMSESFYYLKMFDRAISYASLAVTINDSLGLSNLENYSTIGKILMNKERYSEAINYFHKCHELSIKEDNSEQKFYSLFNIGIVYRLKKNLDSADFFLTKAQRSSRPRFEHLQDHILEQLQRAGDFGDVEIFDALNSSYQLDSADFQDRTRYYDAKVKIYISQKLYSNALEAQIELMKLKDSVYKTENVKQAIELETKYQTVQKEQRITFLEKEQKLKAEQLKQKNKLIYGGATGSSIIFFLASLAVYNQRQRQKAQKALSEIRRVEAERSKKLEVFAAQIQAQEEEKERIARELHDGIAPSLAALKWTINDHLPNQKEALKVYKQLTSITEELQVLSRGLSSPSAKETTLTENLITYLSAQERSGLYIDFKLPDDGLPSMRKPVEIAIYRAIQELTQNCIKHAEATKLIVVFEVENSVLRIKMEDNGNGFDPKTAHPGIGLQNIKNRIQDLDGTFSIYPNLGIGTTVHIELDLRA